MIKIKEVENGWIVQVDSDDLDDKIYVFSYLDRGKDDVEAFADLLKNIHDLMAPISSKKKIRIEVKNGEKK